MRAAILTFFVAACAAHLATPRKGWQSCKTDGIHIVCRGTEVARVVCMGPSAESCGALAIAYSGGERVFLYRPAGFDPAHPAFTGGGAVQPEITSDASLIWFRDGDVRGDVWHVYDPEIGVMQERDAMAVAQLRERGSVPIPLVETK